MPKRWKVTYAGAVFDAANGPHGGQFSALDVKAPTRIVEADEMEVNGGAVVFSTDGDVELVFSPDAYWLVEPEDPRSRSVT